MPRGAVKGISQNQGRRKGVPNKFSAARAARAEQSGIMPADILLNIARDDYVIYLEERVKTGKNRDEAKIDKAKYDAREAAKEAAPYYHSKLATLKTQLPLDNKGTTLEQLVMASFKLGQAVGGSDVAQVTEIVDEGSMVDVTPALPAAE